MPGFTDVAHCATCGACTLPCLIGEAPVLDNVGAGTWVYSEFSGTKRWATDSYPAYRYSTLGSGADPWRISSVVNAVPTDGNTTIVRLVGGLLDFNNYIYAELRYFWDTAILGPDGLPYPSQFEHKIAKMVSGSFTTLAQQPFVANYESVTRLAPKWVLCWDGSRVRSTLLNSSDNDTGWGLTSAAGVTSPGNKFAIATVALHAGQTATFDNVLMERGYGSGTPTCAECRGGSCCNSPTWRNVEVEFSGGCSYPGGPISPPLSFSMSGTWTVPNGSNGIVLGRNGDSTCGWQITTTFSYVVDGVARSGTGYILLTYLGNSLVQLDAFDLTNNFNFGRWKGTVPSIYCNEWSTSFLTLTYIDINTGLPSTDCTTFIAKIRPLP